MMYSVSDRSTDGTAKCDQKGAVARALYAVTCGALMRKTAPTPHRHSRNGLRYVAPVLGQETIRPPLPGSTRRSHAPRPACLVALMRQCPTSAPLCQDRCRAGKSGALPTRAPRKADCHNQRVVVQCDTLCAPGVGDAANGRYNDVMARITGSEADARRGTR